MTPAVVQRSMAAAALVAAALGAQWLATVGSARAEDAKPVPHAVHYNPAKCSPPVTDHKVWIRLGQSVFAFPAGHVSDIRGMSDVQRESLRAVPDPRQPEGCPDNPMWGSAFHIAFSYPGSGGDREAPEWASAALIYSEDDLAHMQSVNEEGARRRCEQGTPGSLKQEIQSRFTVCRIKPEVELPVEEWGATFVADPQYYAAPGGRSFIVFCISGELTSAIYGCNVSYRLRPQINVSYGVDFKRTSIEEVVLLDKSLRRAISDAEIVNYKWPDQQVE